MYVSLAIVIGLLILRYAPGGDGIISPFIVVRFFVACLLDPNVRSTCPEMSISDPCPLFPWHAQVPIALYGFVITATWIDFIADHLVALLEFLGIVARIPNYIMELTVSDDFRYPILFVFSPFFSCVLSTPHNCALVASYIYIRFSRGVIQCPIFPATSPWHARDLRIWQSRRASRDRCSISSSDWDAGSEYCGMPRAMRIHLTPAIRTGFVFCFVNCGLLLVTGLAINKGMIPSGYGYSAIVLYIVCIGTSLLLQFLL